MEYIDRWDDYLCTSCTFEGRSWSLEGLELLEPAMGFL